MPSESKIINDPVFGFINIPKGLLLDIVCHPLMQRLTRIRQLGMSFMVYPGAQHTRFQHSLGAFYLTSEAIRQLSHKGIFIFDSEAEAVQAAILMHDIGHGPFSHVLEDIFVPVSMRSIMLCFLSATYLFTKRLLLLEDDFQSISRMLSPGTYSRRSSKFMLRPIKTETYVPSSTLLVFFVAKMLTFALILVI